MKQNERNNKLIDEASRPFKKSKVAKGLFLSHNVVGKHRSALLFVQ